MYCYFQAYEFRKTIVWNQNLCLPLLQSAWGCWSAPSFSVTLSLSGIFGEINAKQFLWEDLELLSGVCLVSVFWYSCLLALERIFCIWHKMFSFSESSNNHYIFYSVLVLEQIRLLSHHLNLGKPCIPSVHQLPYFWHRNNISILLFWGLN